MIKFGINLSKIGLVACKAGSVKYNVTIQARMLVYHLRRIKG